MIIYFLTRDWRAGLFSIYLLFIVIVELTGRYIGRVLVEPNFQLFNISVPIEYIFFSFIFYREFQTQKNKLIAKIFLIIFPVFAIINWLFIEGPKQFNTNFLKVGSAAMILLACLYMTELLLRDRRINLFKAPMFWITTGVFIFNAGEFVYSAMSHVIFQNWSNWLIVVSKINHSLIYVLYSCIIIGIIALKWTRTEQ